MNILKSRLHDDDGIIMSKLKYLVALAKKILKTLPLYFYVKHWLGSTRVLVLPRGGGVII